VDNVRTRQGRAGDAGEEFITKLHHLTGATIYASTTKVGNAALGGNWELDVTTTTKVQNLKSKIPSLFSPAALQNYAGVLHFKASTIMITPLAAQQLADFMEKQKSQFGFRGDELQKKQMWYFHKRLDENWVNFVVTILASFKEQMRLLGDYFEMVVRVVESPDILTMLGPSPNNKAKRNWWGGAAAIREKEINQEKELRNRLLGEHIKFFNARLVEVEDEINNRSESVDAILEGLTNERSELETEIEEKEFVRDLFSKKGEKLLCHLTDLMTGPLFTIPDALPVNGPV